MIKIILIFLPLVGFCEENQDVIRGTGNISVEQYQWIGNKLDLAIDAVRLEPGKTVIMGKFIIRADGEILSGKVFSDAARDGFIRNKITVVDENSNSADYLVKGSVDVFVEDKDAESLKLYVVRIDLVNVKNKEVVFSKKVEVINAVEKTRDK